jgi:hypothetical protein
VGTALLQLQFIDSYPSWSNALGMLVLGGSLVAAAVLVIARLGVVQRVRPAVSPRTVTAIALAGVLLGVVALSAAPATWAAASIAGGAGGTWLPQAGSTTGSGGGPGGGFGGQHGGFAPGGNGGRPGGSATGGFSGGGPGGSGTGGFSGGGPGGSGTGGFSGGGTGGSGTGGFSGGGTAAPGARGFTGGTASARPSSGQGRGGFGGGGGSVSAGGNGAMTFAGGNVQALDPALLSYLKAHQGTARYLVATATSSYASLFILATNQPVMALGGYQGWDRVLTLPQLKAEIAAGTVRFFYLSGTAASTGTTGATAAGTFHATATQATTSSTSRSSTQNLADTNDDLTTWVQSTCSVVSSKLLQTATNGSTTSATRTGSGGGMQLYDCAGKAK